MAVLSPTGSSTGAELAAQTVTSIVSQSESSPSETHTSKVAVPIWVVLGVQVKAPPAVIEAPAGTAPEVPGASVKVSVSPASGSLAVAVKASSEPVAAVLSPTGSSTGAELAALTVTSIVSQSESSPSETHTSKVAVPIWVVLGVQVKAPPAVIEAPAGTAPEGPGARVKVSVSPASGSLAVAVKASSEPVSAVLSPTGSSTGAELAALTVTSIVSQSESSPSETHTSKVAVPIWVVLGVQVKAPPAVIEAPAGTAPEVPGARVKVSVSPASGSLAVAVKASSEPVSAVLSPTGSSTGAELAALTVTSIVSQSESSPSETHTSKVAVPIWVVLGVQVKAPPAVIEAPAGTAPEVPGARVKVSVSPASGSLAVAVKASSEPVSAVLSPTGSSTGAELAALTVTSIVSQSESSPSETHTSKVAVPIWVVLGVQVKAPPAVIEAPAGTAPEVPGARVKVSVSPASGSLAVAVKASC